MYSLLRSRITQFDTRELLDGKFSIHGYELALLPIPRLENVPQGFDALFQFRNDILALKLAETVRRSTFDIELNDVEFSEAAAATIEAAAASQAHDTYIYKIGYGLIRHRIEFKAERIQLRIEMQQLDLDEGETLVGTLVLKLQFVLILRESDESYSIREYSENRTLPEIGEASLAQIMVQKPVQLAIEINAPLGRFWAKASLVGEWVFPSTGDPLGVEFANQESVRRVISSFTITQLRLTPVCSILRDQPISRISGADQFVVLAVITKANTIGSKTLHIAVSLRSRRVTHIDRVRPFHGSSEFAYFLSSAIVEAKIATAWQGTSETQRRIHATSPVPLSRDGHPFQAEGTFLAELVELTEGRISSAPGVLDHIRIIFETRIQLEELRDESGNRIELTGELAGLAVPATYDTDIMLRLFENIAPFALHGTPLGSVLARVVDTILSPFVRHSQHLRIMAGKISRPIGGIFLTGDIR